MSLNIPLLALCFLEIKEKVGLCIWPELFQLMKKHVCDGRWEVRDSTLEFITQLTSNLKGILMMTTSCSVQVNIET